MKPEQFPDFLTRLCGSTADELKAWSVETGAPIDFEQIVFSQLDGDRAKRFWDDYYDGEHLERRRLVLAGSRAVMKQLHANNLIIAARHVAAGGDGADDALRHLGTWIADTINNDEVGAVRQLMEAISAIRSGKTDDNNLPIVDMNRPRTAHSLDLRAITVFGGHVWAHSTLPTKRYQDRYLNLVDEIAQANRQTRESRMRVGLRYLPEE